MIEAATGPIAVLYVGPDTADRKAVADELGSVATTVRLADGVAGVREALAAATPDVVVTEHDLPDGDALSVIDAVGAVDAAVDTVVFTDADDPGITGRVFDAGAEFVPRREDGADRLRRRLRGIAADDPSTGVSAAIKQRAIDEAPVGITVADVRVPDEPLVYVNDAFERLTGYSAADVVGRNCRFLQGPDTDPGSTATLREAIDEAEPASVELRNRRRDGESFWNRVDVAPIHDDTGELTHYVGFQTDVTRRRRAEAAAQRWATESREERRAVEHVLDRVEGLVTEVTEALIEAGSRRALERAVCECIASTDGYDGAWIGAADPPREVVTARATAGTVPGLDATRSLPMPAGGVVDRAVETDAVVVESVDAVVDGVDPDRKVAIVPVCYREAVYGAVCVFPDEQAGFDSHDTTVLASIGRAIGTAINAIESKRMAATDGVVDVEMTAEGGALSGLAAALGCRLETEGVTRRDDGSVLLFLRADAAVAKEDLDAAIDDSAVDPVATSAVVGGEADSLVEVALAATSSLGRVNDLGVRLIGLEANSARVHLEFEAPGEPAARSLLDVLSERYDSVFIERIRRLDRGRRPEWTRLRSADEELTDRQRTALEKAYRAGFFEWPHAVSGDELADSMDITRSTFHQHLRAAERKVMGAFFDEE
jgi:PAS domain S-box